MFPGFSLVDHLGSFGIWPVLEVGIFINTQLLCFVCTEVCITIFSDYRCLQQTGKLSARDASNARFCKISKI